MAVAFAACFGEGLHLRADQILLACVVWQYDRSRLGRLRRVRPLLAASHRPAREVVLSALGFVARLPVPGRVVALAFAALARTSNLVGEKRLLGSAERCRVGQNFHVPNFLIIWADGIALHGRLVGNDLRRTATAAAQGIRLHLSPSQHSFGLHDIALQLAGLDLLACRGKGVSENTTRSPSWHFQTGAACTPAAKMASQTVAAKKGMVIECLPFEVNESLSAVDALAIRRPKRDRRLKRHRMGVRFAWAPSVAPRACRFAAILRLPPRPAGA